MVDTIFNILNLLVRVGLVIFLIRKYVMHRIAQSIVNEKEALNMLEQQHGQIKESSSAVERNIKHQEQLYDDLRAKFVVWQESVSRTLRQDQQKCLVQQKKMQLQIEKKQQYVQRRHIIEQELPELLAQTVFTLRQEFEQDKTLGKTYITKVLRALHE